MTFVKDPANVRRVCDREAGQFLEKKARGTSLNKIHYIFEDGRVKYSVHAELSLCSAIPQIIFKKDELRKSFSSSGLLFGIAALPSDEKFWRETVPALCRAVEVLESKRNPFEAVVI